MLLVGQFVFFIWLALQRLIAPDEGFYVMAAKLVTQGKVPYLDFFYPQMPLLPYLHALPVKLGGPTWPAVRVLSALLASLLGLLIWRHVLDHFGKFPALLSLVLYCGSGMAFIWYSVVKAYAAAAFFLVLAFFLVESGYGKRRLGLL